MVAIISRVVKWHFGLVFIGLRSQFSVGGATISPNQVPVPRMLHLYLSIKLQDANKKGMIGLKKEIQKFWLENMH
jgi:hypothetical protein